MIGLTALYSIVNTAQVQTSFYSRDRINNQTRLVDGVSTSLMIFPSLLFLTFALNQFYDFHLGTLLFLVPINSLFFSIWEIIKSYKYREQDYTVVVRLQLINRIVSQGTKLSAAFSLNSFLFFSEPISHLISIFYFYRRSNLRFNFSPRDIYQKYRKYALYYTPIGLVNFMTAEGPILILSYLGSPKEVSAFFLLNRTLFSPLNLIGNTFSNSIIARISDDTLSDRQNLLLKSYSVFIFFSILIVAVIYFNSIQIVTFVFGNQYVDMAKMLNALCFVIPLRLLKGIITNVGINSGHFKTVYFNKIALGLTLCLFVYCFSELDGLELLTFYFLIEFIFETIHLVIGLLKPKATTHIHN